MQFVGHSPRPKTGTQLLRMMKLTAFFMLAACLHVTATSFGQHITLHLQNVPVEKALQEIKRQSGALFLYNSSELKKLGKVTLSMDNGSIDEALSRVLKSSGFTYKKEDGTIILLPAPSPAYAAPAATAVTGPISGRITDEQGNPLTGASVRIKIGHMESNKGAITDQDGRFTLNASTDKVTVIVSFIGYQTEEFTILPGEKPTLHLKKAQNPLDQMVIVGYGSTSKRLNTGNVSSITSEDISKETVTNPITALQGRIPGMQITQDNGLPGAGLRVNIRGASSTFSQAGFIPLYVVDGVPFTLFNGGTPASDNLNAYGLSGANGSISPFSLIDPSDIERIDVLKDADATAIYGSRGANGVVLITTKKGSKTRTSYSINAYTGFEKVAHYIPMLNTQQYLQMRKEAFANAGVTPTTTNAPDLTVWDPNANTNWQKWGMGGTAPITNITASAGGGSPLNSFLFTSTFRKEGTVFRGPFDATTISNRLTAGHTSEDRKFNINGSVNYTSMVNNLPQTDMSTYYTLPPNLPLYSNNKLYWPSTSLANPIAALKQPYNATSTNLIGNMTVSYKLLPGLTLKTDLGYTLTRLKQTIAQPASTKNPASSTLSTLSYADNDNSNYSVEPQINYNRILGRGKLDVLGGATFNQDKSTGVYLYGSGFSNEALIENIAAASTVTTYYDNDFKYKYNAFFGRINYTYEDKYILDLTGRRDGSSRFGSNYRFGNFGAAGAAWIISQEEFMKQLHAISFAKLRVSYGLTGNDQIPNFQYLPTYGVASSSYSYQGSTVLYVSNIANPNLHWETTKKLDIGLELGFFHDRLSLKSDFYHNRTSNLLTYISEASQSGSSGYYGNFPAVIQNQGFEFELNTVNINSKQVHWTTSINLTLNSNKLISYPNLATSSYANTYKIGRPTDITWLYHYTGISTTTGQATFTDVNKDGTISIADRSITKYGTPYYGGITNEITCKGFDLSFTFQFNHRYGYINSNLANNFYPFGYSMTNQTTEALDRAPGIGAAGKLPIANINTSTSYSNLYSSDYNWGNASYIKLKTVSLSYSLPKQLIKKIGFASWSFYAQGQNIFTWAKQKYTYDPETSLPGTGSALSTGRYTAFPQLRTIVFGLNCSF